jgi:hypothetical protein
MIPKSAALLSLALLCAVSSAPYLAAADASRQKSSKQRPLQVYIMAGQSNMEGHGHVRVMDYMGEDPLTKPLLAKMKKRNGDHRMIDDVWISYLTGISGRIDAENREVFGQLTTGFGSQVNRNYDKPGERIGPELAFGITMQEGLEQPILIIKTAWGGQSMHTDFRSPSSGPYVPSADDVNRKRFETEEQKAELAAKTGARYRQMVDHVRMVLDDIERVYPKYKSKQGYELAGFIWFQGFNDLVGRNVYPTVSADHPTPRYAKYTEWFANFVRDVRLDLKAPDLPFVMCVLGVGGLNANQGTQDFRVSQAAIADLPEFVGNVRVVPTAPYWDEEIGKLDQKRADIRQKRHLLNTKNPNHENADGKMSEQDIKDFLAEFEKQLFSAEDLALEKRGKSNGGYHYLGSVKTYSQIGQAAARALLAGPITPHHRGLHGYIGYSATRPPAQSEYSAGMGFYSAVWPLIDKPLANFQIGLAGAWISPNNSDNKDQPLAPEGTLARKWPERGPTWASVFQTVEGGLGYWRGNRFRYGPPKFSMNATPQCYDYEVGSPGWSFFYDTEALPDDRLGIAQLSNRLLIPPDALPFEGNPNGKFLGYTYMALPFTDPVGVDASAGSKSAPADSPSKDAPTGDQAWTCFLSTANFKGPMAYYIPETWSKIADLFDYPFLHGRGLDSRPGNMGGGAMEINTVPRFTVQAADGNTYSKIPKLNFAVDEKGRSILVQDVTYYSKAALYDAFKAWRDGGELCSGEFDPVGAWRSDLTTRFPHFDQAGDEMTGIEKSFDTAIFDGNVWGLRWSQDGPSPVGTFPQYYKHVGDKRVAIAADEVPTETGLLTQNFKLAERGQPFTSPGKGAWSEPGPKSRPLQVRLGDGSLVTYSWYRFIDQPSFQQYNWSEAKREKLQAFVEKIHRQWPIDRDYMPPPTTGELVRLDPALFVTPPTGMEIGYVPIVTRQEDASANR